MLEALASFDSTDVSVIVGALGLYLLSLNNESPDAQHRLEKLLPFFPKTAIHWIDGCFVVFFGAYVAGVFVAPTTPAQGLSAGLGWVGFVNATISAKPQT